MPCLEMKGHVRLVPSTNLSLATGAVREYPSLGKKRDVGSIRARRTLAKETVVYMLNNPQLVISHVRHITMQTYDRDGHDC